METGYEKRGYLLDDFRLFHLKDREGTNIDYHYHEFCKLLMLRSGSGGYTVDGQRYSLDTGDIVLIGSGCVHRPEFEHGSLYERVIIYISPEFLQQQSIPDCPLLDIFNGEHGHVLHLHQPDILWNLSDALEQELSKDEYGRVILSNGLLLRLLIEIARGIRNPETTFAKPIVPSDSRILEILRYIDAHLTEELSIDILAEEFFISKFHMMRLFKQETGRSIHDYLQERRLLFARDLIRQGVSATDSCFQSGFRSYSSFTRAYAKHFGTTPTGRKGAPAAETYE
ncbi:MAG: helix-turn-helix domain-containing protein [Anaerotignum sp.]|nr:helix-turn-helix domain-containing protein [Anaerotignum sp.]MBP3306236.1 helix-turn-helix domain-containing protein [Anaerotignum sp.]